MFFKRSPVSSDIHEGSVYYRRLHKNYREQAKVVSVSDDGLGIPHVHFEMTYMQPGKPDPQGRRVLALECFNNEYQTLN